MRQRSEAPNSQFHQVPVWVYQALWGCRFWSVLVIKIWCFFVVPNSCPNRWSNPWLHWVTASAATPSSRMLCKRSSARPRWPAWLQPLWIGLIHVNFSLVSYKYIVICYIISCQIILHHLTSAWIPNNWLIEFHQPLMDPLGRREKPTIL